MYAETIDSGATIDVLRAFGPPEVVELDDFLGNGSVELAASKFWTVVRAVCINVNAANLAVNRFPRLTWRAIDDAPFAQVISPLPVAATVVTNVSFAVGVQQFGNGQAGTLVVPIAELVLLPGWTLTVDLVGGQAGDKVTGVRAYQQRYQLIDVDSLLEGD